MRLAAALLAALALAVPSAAHANAYLPPAGKVFAGASGGYDVHEYARLTHTHPPVFQLFAPWGWPPEFMFRYASAARSRLAIHVGTWTVHYREGVTPRGMARGAGDSYLLGLSARIAQSGQPVYVRLMAEMNNWRNPYCAYGAGGFRGGAHAQRWYKQAWRRTVTLFRGGPVSRVNARLRALHLPRVRSTWNVLPQPQVAFLWVPMTAGSPDVRGNSPGAYWPGSRWVDWIGTDFYSKFPNFSGLDRFYSQFRHKPFAFGEWALWGRDDPAFVHRFIRWVRTHRRVRMILYNQEKPGSPFRLGRYPRAAAALRRELRSRRFVR
jgi:hypothetical protein